MSVTLAPREGAEIKLVIVKGAQANYAWTVNGAVVNFDTMVIGAARMSPTIRAAASPRTRACLKLPLTTTTAGFGATSPRSPSP